MASPMKHQTQSPEVLTLHQLAEQQSKSLPISVSIVQGYYGRHSELALHNEDTYIIHFVKHTRVVTLKDIGGNQYSVPLNSSFTFGLVYTTAENQQKPEIGIEFDKCSDILDMSVLPKVVCAIRNFQGKDKKSTVLENEILVVQPHKSQKKKGLNVFSLLTRSEKILPAECAAHFSTKPSLIRMHLLDIAEHVPNVFPCQALMFLDESAGLKSPKLHSSLLSNPVSLVDSQEEVSLIASTAKHTSSLKENPLLDIPVDDKFSQVEFTIVKTPSGKEMQMFRDRTRQIIDTFDPTKVIYFKDTNSSRSYKTQSTFYTTARSGHERTNMTLKSSFGVKVMQAPKKLLPVPSVPQPTSAFEGGKVRENEVVIYEELPDYYSPESVSDENERKPPRNIAACSKQRPLPPPKPQTKRSASVSQPSATRIENSQYEPMDPIGTHPTNDARSNDQQQTSQKHQWIPNHPHPRPASAATTLEDRITNLESQSRKQEEAHKKLTAQLNHLAKQVKSLEATVRSASTSASDANNAAEPESTDEKNKKNLRSLTAFQVQQLLEALNLQQYKEAFRAEYIDGEILHDLDEQVLQDDLGITSKLHRIRLMKIISGARSVEGIF